MARMPNFSFNSKLKILKKISPIKFSTVLSFLLIALSVFYYFIIFLPQKENQRLKIDALKVSQQELDKMEKKFKEKERIKNINECITEAGNNYLESWNAECEYRGLKKECALPDSVSLRLDKIQKEGAEYCFKLYP